MRFSFSAIAISTLSLVSSALAAFPNPGKVSGSVDVHDPAICRNSAGKWFLFSTAPGIGIRTSTDRYGA
ncbi:arabinan endo-1,5-alpha-L-arabinosidase, partial [Rhizoctonia solani AG-3 Rhs1AP]